MNTTELIALLQKYFSEKKYDEYMKVAYENRTVLVNGNTTHIKKEELSIAAKHSVQGAIWIMTSRLSSLLQPQAILAIYHAHRKNKDYVQTVLNFETLQPKACLLSLVVQDKTLINTIKESGALILIFCLQLKMLKALANAKQEKAPEIPDELQKTIKDFEEKSQSEKSSDDMAASSSSNATIYLPGIQKDPMTDKKAAQEFLKQEPSEENYKKYIEVAYKWRENFIKIISHRAGNSEVITVINSDFLKIAALSDKTLAATVLKSSALSLILAPAEVNELVTKHKFAKESLPQHVIDKLNQLTITPKASPLN